MTTDKCAGFSLIEVLVAISLMALIAVYLGAKTVEIAAEDKFYKTCYMMEEIKEAIIGRPGLYCNGVRQFTGYVSDMGNMPNLYYFDDDKKEFIQVTHAESGEIEAAGLAEALLDRHRPQPPALWSKGFLVEGGLPEWKYHEDAQLWAGWRGPYIDPPPSCALRDAWGNKFIFVVGEVVGYEGKTYRCKTTFTSTKSNPVTPGSHPVYWEVINDEEMMNFRVWKDMKDRAGLEERFYNDHLVIISLGADNKPGGEGLKKDISIVVAPEEYLGEVAGNAGYQGHPFATKITLFYPNFTEEGESVESIELSIANDTEVSFIEDVPFDQGINFRFGAVQALKSEKKWSCTGRTTKPYGCNDEAKNNLGCTCIEEGDGAACVKGFHCYSKSCYWRKLRDKCGGNPLADDPPCACQKWGVPRYSDLCVDAICSVDQCKVCRYCSCDCIGYEQVCHTWICKDEIGIGNRDCNCSEVNVSVEYDDPNWVQMNVPIGIRSIKADKNYCMFSVCPGGNWIGTVRGE